MQHTTNYNLNKFDATDLLEDTSRLGLNSNFDTIDAALKEASENGGIAVQDTQPTTDVLAWIDSDQLGADFCFVGDTEPTNDGSVAVWVDTSEDEIPIQAGASGVSYDNTDSGLTADNVQGAIDEIAEDTGYVAISGDLTTAGGDAFYRRVGKAVLITIISLGKLQITSTAKVIGTLPEDCRPSKEMQFAGAGQGATITNDIMFAVKTNGAILVYSVNTTVYYSGTFMFFVD